MTGEDIGGGILLIIMYGFAGLVVFGFFLWIMDALFGAKHPGNPPSKIDLVKMFPDQFTEEEAREYYREQRQREKEMLQRLLQKR